MLPWSRSSTCTLNGVSVAVHTHACRSTERHHQTWNQIPHRQGFRWHTHIYTHTQACMHPNWWGEVCCLWGTESDNSLDKQHRPVKELREAASLMAPEDLLVDAMLCLHFKPRACIAIAHVYRGSCAHFQKSRGEEGLTGFEKDFGGLLLNSISGCFEFTLGFFLTDLHYFRVLGHLVQLFD